MEDIKIYLYFLIGAIVIIVINIRVFLSFRKSKRKIEEQERQTREKLYEIAILKELGERIGYSLNIDRIVDIIVGSVSQFIQYDCACSLHIQGPELIFKANLSSSLSRSFIEDIKSKLFTGLKTRTKKKIKKGQIVEMLSGAILVDEFETKLNSYYELPLKIKGEIIGIIGLGSKKEGLFKSAKDMAVFDKIVQQTELSLIKFEQAIELEKAKLSSMIESMVDGVIMTDKQSHIVVVNPSAKSLIGAGSKDQVTIFDFIESFSGSFDIRGRLEESIMLKKTITLQDIQIENRFFQIFIAPVKHELEEDEIIGGVVLFHDITHEKEIEKMRQDFTSMMVHDLRSPLDGIKKMIQIIKEGADKKTEQKYAEMIHKASSEMLDLVNELLDVAKFESGKFEVFLEESDVKELLTEKTEYYKPISAKKNISLQLEISPKLPKKINMDNVRISRVVNNLLSNAVKFTPENGSIIINAFLHEQGANIFKESAEEKVKWLVKKDEKKLIGLPESVIISVTDSGPGVKHNEKESIFEKYQQSKIQSAGEKFGTGLGLSIAKGIVSAHNGIIGVSSQEGAGSTFWFTIPTIRKPFKKGFLPFQY